MPSATVSRWPLELKPLGRLKQEDSEFKAMIYIVSSEYLSRICLKKAAAAATTTSYEENK